ncbi:MAG TPA: dTMP kinase [Pseudonocardiaceae bacterium]
MGERDQEGRAEVTSASTRASTLHRMRSVLAIPAFRRLWTITALCSIGDWLSLLALTSLAYNLTTGYTAQSFALGGVVATQLLPAMLFAPVAGVLADRFDRRKVMVVCDILRCLLFLSIPLVGSLWWLFVANFLIQVCALFWIPAKDASIPNLLRRPDQVETANQLGLVMTYGVAVVVASGLFSALSAIGPTLHLPINATVTVYIALVLNGLAFLTSAVVVATRIPEISGRAGQRPAPGEQPGLFGMLRDGARFVGTTPLVRGLVIGIIGAFAAGGAVIACAKLYAQSLSGGDAAYGMLFTGVFIGLGTGMAITPKCAERIPHNRLFGMSIVAAGLVLMLVAFAPHLWVALATVVLVGCCAGVAFLTGLTIIGAQVEDAVRGRTVAFVQSLVRLDLLASMAVVPVLVGLVKAREISLFGRPVIIDGTRPVLLGAGLLAAVLGVVAYRQMDDRRKEPILSDLLAILRRSRRHGKGLLLAVEGSSVDTAAQARRLADWLRAEGREVVLAADPALDESRLLGLFRNASLSSARAHALVAAAVRAEVVECVIRPALDSGALVVMERYVDTPLARLGAVGEIDQEELESLADWATGRLRPDITVLLDRDPTTLRAGEDGESGSPGSTGARSVEYQWRVHHLLTEMAAADPDRYVVVDADGTEDEVAERVRARLAPVLAARRVAVSGADSIPTTEARTR